MSFSSTFFLLYHILFHTYAFLKEVLAFQMQDVIFLEFNSTFSHACELGVSCVTWSVVRSSAAQYVLIFALRDTGEGRRFTLHLHQIVFLRGAQGNAVRSAPPVTQISQYVKTPISVISNKLLEIFVLH